MMDESTQKVILQVLECDLEAKKRAIMAAIEHDHDNVLPQHIKNYRTVFHAKEEFLHHTGVLNKAVKE